MSTETEDERKQVYAHQSAWLQVLRHAMREVSVFGQMGKITPETEDALISARAIAELAEARNVVSRLCGEHGVKYEFNLHLGDMIENHLVPAIEDSESEE